MNAKHLSGVLLSLSWCVIIGDSMRCQCQSVQWGTAADDAAGWEKNMIKFVNNSFKCPPRDILIQQQLRCIHLQQEVTSMAMQLHGFFSSAPRTAMRYSEFLAMAAAIGDLCRTSWNTIGTGRAPSTKLSDGLNKCAKDKTDNSYTENMSCGLHPCTVVCFLEITNALSVINTHHQDV